MRGLDSPRFNAERRPQASEIARLEALASQAAIAIANAQLYEESEQDRRRLRSLLHERRSPRGEVSQLREEIREAAPFGRIVGAESSLVEVPCQAELVASTDSTVPARRDRDGQGADRQARARTQPSSDTAVRSRQLRGTSRGVGREQLFGHERGAYTGAVTRKPGKFARMASPRLISNAVRLLILMLAMAMALGQIAVAQTVVLTAFAIAFGAVMIGLAIALGIGGGGIARRFLEQQFPERPPSDSDHVSHL